MRNFIYSSLILFVIISFISCEKNNDTSFKVNLKINGADDGWVYLQQNDEGTRTKLDSAEIKNGTAVFTGKTNMPEMFYFTFAKQKGYIPVFIESGTINVDADMQNLKEVKVEGSKSHKVYLGAMNLLDDYEARERALSQQYREAKSQNESHLMDSISNAYDSLENKKTNSIKEYAEKNSASVVAPFFMMRYSYMFELADLESVEQKLDSKISASKYTVALKNRINILKRVEVGQHYVDFTLNDPGGKPLPLSSVAGQNYLLVDFWASWCGPCRAENPNVVAAYHKFHEKGFDVFGVSLDRDHDKWVDAIKKDDLTWSQVSDLKYWGCEAAKLYGVQSIPHNVLINPDGIIIAKDLRGPDLQNKLSELFD